MKISPWRCSSELFSFLASISFLIAAEVIIYRTLQLAASGNCLHSNKKTFLFMIMLPSSLNYSNEMKLKSLFFKVNYF